MQGSLKLCQNITEHKLIIHSTIKQLLILTIYTKSLLQNLVSISHAIVMEYTRPSATTSNTLLTAGCIKPYKFPIRSSRTVIPLFKSSNNLSVQYLCMIMTISSIKLTTEGIQERRMLCSRTRAFCKFGKKEVTLKAAKIRMNENTIFNSAILFKVLLLSREKLATTMSKI